MKQFFEDGEYENGNKGLAETSTIVRRKKFDGCNHV